MNRREELHQGLIELMHGAWEQEHSEDPSVRDFSENVYYQPPSSVLMHYPAIVYQRNTINSRYADNEPYMHKHRYEVTVIDSDPDSIIPDLVADLPMCRHNRRFVSDNLYHDAFDLYY